MTWRSWSKRPGLRRFVRILALQWPLVLPTLQVVDHVQGAAGHLLGVELHEGDRRQVLVTCPTVLHLDLCHALDSQVLKVLLEGLRRSAVLDVREVQGVQVLGRMAELVHDRHGCPSATMCGRLDNRGGLKPRTLHNDLH